jgi:FkbH-like protein
MFEFEGGVRRLVNPPLTFPASLEATLGAAIRRRSLTVWQEHCSECAMPDCYSTCAFYTPRTDYKCQRFTGGAAVLPGTSHAAAPLLIKFGKWARLLGTGPTPLQDVQTANATEARALSRAGWLDTAPGVRGLLAPVRRRMINNRSKTSAWGTTQTDDLYFVVETFSRSENPVALALSCKVLDAPGAAPTPPFQATLTLQPGYNVQAVPLRCFVSAEQVGKPYSMQIAPANDGETPEVAFGFVDVAELDGAPNPAVIVAEAMSYAKAAAAVKTATGTNSATAAEKTATGTSGVAAATGKAATGSDNATAAENPGAAKLPKIKCVVWDLDNTLWQGVLVEDGLPNLRLRAEAVHAVLELDRKGILQSVASKNDHEGAMQALEHFGLKDYFLYPQVSWGPKSQAVATIRQALNIGIDTFAFVDDQQFERAEVLSQHPLILGIDALQLAELTTNERLQVEITAEGATRRKMYQEEAQRNAAFEGLPEGNYEEFLRSCAIGVEIAYLAEPDLERANELAQRTNQLNTSATRYTADQLRKMMTPGSPMRALTVRASDKFGKYGLIGLAVVDEPQGLIAAMMYSCRIQGKLVDDAMVSWLEATYGRAQPLRARFNATKKNTPARQLLERTGFELETSDANGEIWKKARLSRPLEELEKIINVSAPSRPDMAEAV